jgi:hypothetical protein
MSIICFLFMSGVFYEIFFMTGVIEFNWFLCHFTESVHYCFQRNCHDCSVCTSVTAM